MELLARAILGIVVVVVILLALFYALQSSFFQQVTKQQAESLVVADLQRTYQGSSVQVLNDTPSNYSGSWHITTSLILNSTSPCPDFFIYTFDYPQFGFVYRVQNTYTNNCVIYGLTQSKPFIISSYPVAITRSYLLGISSVSAYINSVGFGNVKVTANFFNSTSLFGSSYTNVWLVNYNSMLSNHSVSVLLTQVNGTLLTAYNTSNS
jgi:hypothetical protein